MSGDLKHCCGVFGVIGHPEAARISYLGLYALQHRGQESAGIASLDRGAMFVERDMGYVADVFDAARLDRLPGRTAIGHVRYSTSGASSLRNAQPVRIESRHGAIALGHNGNLVNIATLRDRLEGEGAIFTSDSDTEVMLHLFARSEQPGAVEALVDALGQVRGAFTLTVLTQSEIVGVRDPLGFRPLSIGWLDGAVVLASETSAFDLIGAELLRDVEPGELVIVGEEAVGSEAARAAIAAGPNGSGSGPGYRSAFPWRRRQARQCIFEHVYFARPDSVLFGSTVQQNRKAMGRILAEEAPVDADIVVPVPDGGLFAAQGYADASGIPFEYALIRNHYVGRTFIEPRQAIRHFGVKVKLNPVRALIEGRRVLLVDDSIVRGTTSAKIVEMVRDAGAREVHMRVSSPPYVSPCYYGIDTPRREELIGANESLDEIRAHIGADSLHYLSLEGLRRAVPHGDRDFCTACFTGEYPTRLSDEIEDQLELFTPTGHGPASPAQTEAEGEPAAASSTEDGPADAVSTEDEPADADRVGREPVEETAS